MLGKQKKSKIKNQEVKKIKNGKIMLLFKRAVCGSKISKFI